MFLSKVVSGVSEARAAPISSCSSAKAEALVGRREGGSKADKDCLCLFKSSANLFLALKSLLSLLDTV